jgi:addiction module HigA family antidote
MITIKREPTSPGEILQEEFLTPPEISQKQLADHLGCDVKVINRIATTGLRPSIKGMEGMDLKLGYALNTSPQFWLNAQQAVDIYSFKIFYSC